MYFFFLIFLAVHALASPTLPYCRQDQRDALLEFKHEFLVNESNSILSLSSWNKTSDCCSWEGIMCDAKSGEVLSLSLDSIPLNNSLKPDSGLFKLQHLRNLTLSNCNLSGELPSSLGNLSHLTKLHLSKNYLVGEIPASFGNLNQLRDLSLADNQFSGNIPFSFANFTKLSQLLIQNNQFTGEFPLPLLNLTTSLFEIVISDNLFKSTLPPDMSQFHNLENFDVGGNSFFGSFPTSLFMNPSLRIVSLRKNRFNGPIEFRNASSFSKLHILFLEQNKFNGPIPKSISKFSNLKNLDLHDNDFTGSIPNLVNLEYLDLSYNKLVGEISGSLGNVSELTLSHNFFTSFGKSLDLENIQTLDLSSNHFLGPLPHWICKLRPSLVLDFSNNNFNGSLPQCLSNIIVDLATLNLQNNNFSGTLPDIFANATNLVSLDVSGNKLEGNLPKSLINCISLEFLNVRSNKIKDTFPSWLRSLPSLNVMILRANEFYGPLYHHHPHASSIGFQSLKIIDISHNHFNGTLPPFYFSSWHEMINITKKVSEYMEDGYSYINSMEMVNKGVDMLFELIRTDFGGIDFSGNNLVGKIPESIGSLKGLRILNLSSNGFTDNIPQTMANLTNLEALDLSRNQLSGQIPQNLGSLSFLSIMDFSYNNLQGPIPRSTQFQRQNCSAFLDNPRLYGLEDVCGETHVPKPTPQESEDFYEQKEQVISWIAVVIAYVPGVFCGLVIGRIFTPHIQKWFM